MSIGTVILLVSYVLPKFKTFFKSFDAKLPLPTRMLLSVGDFFSEYGLDPLVVSVAILVVPGGVPADGGRETMARQGCSCCAPL